MEKWNMPRTGRYSDDEDEPAQTPASKGPGSSRASTPMPPEFGGRLVVVEQRTLAVQSYSRTFSSASFISTPELPILQPVSAQCKKEKVDLISNMFEIMVESRVIYRYDVQMELIPTSNNRRVTDLGFGPKDDAATTKRHRLCLLALKKALEMYRVLSENGAFIYDSSSILFTTEDISNVLKMHGRLEIPVEALDDEALTLIPRDDSKAISVDIAAVREGHRVNVADYEAAITTNMARFDRSLTQFFEILTNQHAVTTRSHLLFGSGRLFSCNPRDHRSFNDGTQLVKGVDKGVRFIRGEPKDNRTVAALVLDSKRAMFFTMQSVLQAACEVLRIRDPNLGRWFDKGSNNYNIFRDYLENVRFRVVESGDDAARKKQFSFVFCGLSKEPVSQLTVTLPGGETISLVEYYRAKGTKLVFPDLPAIVHAVVHDVASNGRLKRMTTKKYYPMECLAIIEGQRVPFSRIGKKPEPVKPQERWFDIGTQMEALNLHGHGINNRVLAAFGVRISPTPVKLTGFRRRAPTIEYGKLRGSNKTVDVDSRMANWKSGYAPFFLGGKASLWVVAYDGVKRSDESAVKEFAKKMHDEGKRRGMHFDETRCERVPFDKLDNFFDDLNKERDEKESKLEGGYFVFVTFIDQLFQKSHGRLKTLEALYQIPTQHVTMERAYDAPRKPQTLENILNKFNCKTKGLNYEVKMPDEFSRNRWIADGDTLILGYDIAHPDPMTRMDRLQGTGPMSPSVVGFAFNGGENPHMFVGDYHFQPPKREEVGASILTERMQWMLDTFQNKRGHLPKFIIVVRDGLSEGQFAMAIRDEMGAIRQGVEEFLDAEYPGAVMPKFSMLVATKRHQRRFFAVTRDSRVDNPLPLTTIDEVAVRPNTSEFYIQSHRAIQGTAKAPLYTPLVNEINMTMDEAQSLMVALCFTHQICTSPISLPEPVYQADEWAKRGKNNFREYREMQNGNVPLNEDGSIDFNEVTNKLSYWGRKLDGVRTNA